MPRGKGDYTDWMTNETPAVSQRSLTRLARLLDMLHMAPATERERLLAGVKAGLEQGATPTVVPERLSRLIATWWNEQPHTGALVDVAARLGHPAAVDVRARAGDPDKSRLADERTAVAGGRERGSDGFATNCAPCHQADGSGMQRLAAPLRNSKWVLGDDGLLVRIVLHGLKGELLMPPMGTLDDRQLAEILTYIRSAWGHRAPPISPERVASVRAASSGRMTPWTVDELARLRAR